VKLRSLLPVLVLVLIAAPAFADRRPHESAKEYTARLESELAACHDQRSTHHWGKMQTRNLRTGRFVGTKHDTVFMTREVRVEVPAEPEAPALSSANFSDRVRNGLELYGGYRWDHEEDCPSCRSCVVSPPPPTSSQVDPFVLGVQERLPLDPSWALQGRIERDMLNKDGDFVQAAHLNYAVTLHWAPLRRVKHGS
jgi:hypothetical protein